MAIVLDPSKQFINITVYYIEETMPHGHTVFHFVRSSKEFENWKTKGYHTEEEIRELLKPTDQKKPAQNVDSSKIIEKIMTTWKRLTWKDQNTIFSKCLRTVPGLDGKPVTELDSISYRDQKLKTCLKKWDLRDENGQVSPVTTDTIDILLPEVAQELLNSFERVTEPTAQELGESKG